MRPSRARKTLLSRSFEHLIVTMPDTNGSTPEPQKQPEAPAKVPLVVGENAYELSIVFSLIDKRMEVNLNKAPKRLQTPDTMLMMLETAAKVIIGKTKQTANGLVVPPRPTGLLDRNGDPI